MLAFIASAVSPAPNFPSLDSNSPLCLVFLYFSPFYPMYQLFLFLKFSTCVFFCRYCSNRGESQGDHQIADYSTYHTKLFHVLYIYYNKDREHMYSIYEAEEVTMKRWWPHWEHTVNTATINDKPGGPLRAATPQALEPLHPAPCLSGTWTRNSALKVRAS